MKKIFLCILMVLMSVGCTQEKEYNDTLKMNSLYQNIFESEEGVEVVLNDNGNIVYYHLEEDHMSLQPKDMSIKKGISTLHYYKDKWYYLTHESKEGEIYLNLYSCDLNGKNSILLGIVDKMKEEEVEGTSIINTKLYIHKDKIYIIGFNQLYVGEVSKTTLKKIDSVIGAQKITIAEDHLYIACDEYEKHPMVLLESDLDGNNIKMLYEEIGTIFVDENFLFYRKLGIDQMHLYILNRNNEEEIKIEDTLQCYGVLKDNGMYVFDTRKNGYNTRTMYVINEEGEILSSKDHNDLSLLQLFKENKIYVTAYDKEDILFGYYPIEENTIKDFIEIK